MSYTSTVANALAKMPTLDSLTRLRLQMRATELDWLREYGEARGLSNVPELADSLQAIYDMHMAELGAR